MAKTKKRKKEEGEEWESELDPAAILTLLYPPRDMISAKFFAASFFSATLSTRTIFALSVDVLSSALLITAP